MTVNRPTLRRWLAVCSQALALTLCGAFSAHAEPSAPPPLPPTADGAGPNGPGPANTAPAAPVLRTVKAQRSCSDLAAFDLTTIGGAGSRITAASTQTSRQNVQVCKVEGVLAPSIKFEIDLPTQSWTQRYLQLGCGGLCGNIGGPASVAQGCVPFQTGGFVTASTDMATAATTPALAMTRKSALTLPIGRSI